MGHTSEIRSMQERHTEEISRLQVEQQNHMSQELVRHTEEVRRLQAEYHSQLKGMGADVRQTALSVANARRAPLDCGQANFGATKETILKDGALKDDTIKVGGSNPFFN